MNVKKTKSSKKIVLKITMSMTIPVTNVPSEKSSKWSTPMWAKNIIPNVVWTDGDIFSPAPSLLKLGYHRSVDAHYLLLTTRELPKCSALGYGLDRV